MQMHRRETRIQTVLDVAGIKKDLSSGGTSHGTSDGTSGAEDFCQRIDGALEKISLNTSLINCVCAFRTIKTSAAYIVTTCKLSGPGKPQLRPNRQRKQGSQQHPSFTSFGVAWGSRDANRVLTVKT